MSPDADAARLGHETVQFFCQHLVALAVSFRRPDGSTGSDIFSGLILEVRGCWFFVTAGHTLEDLYTGLPACQDVRCELHDSWQPMASHTPVPFDLLNAGHFAIDDEDGLDVGIVEVAPIIRRMLEANQIRAFSEVAWRDPPADMLTHSLLGLPDKFTTALRDRFQVRPTMVNLEKIQPPPGMERRTPCFYGKLPAQLVYQATTEPLDEMVGFSGGPILGFRRNARGEMKYFAVAVQSVWRKDLRVVRGPLLSVVGEALDAKLTGRPPPRPDTPS